jgi:hypothetical protein
MGLLQRFGQGALEHKTELAGLGILAAPSVDEAQAHIRAGLAGDYNHEGVKKRTLLPSAVKPATEIGGLGVLALPSAAHLLSKHAVAGLFDELVKLSAITDDEARRSLDRYDQLQKSAPTAGQALRYGALGVGAGSLGSAVKSTIEHGRLPSARGALGSAASNAIVAGALPFIRSTLDRSAEKRTLKGYLAQEHVGNYAPNQGASTDVGTPTGLSR